MEQDAQKRAAAEWAVEEVANGMIVGLGTGSTAAFMVEALGRKARAGLRIKGVPTSERTAAQARGLRIPLTTLDDLASSSPQPIDLTIDGADEVAANTLHLIKGLGGALLREKIVASASQRLIIIADESKLVEKLGAHAPVPVEVAQFGWHATANHLRAIGAKVALRMNGQDAFVTDGGNYILDCAFGSMDRPETIAEQVDRITGVVEHGLFLGMTSKVFVGTAEGVRVLQR